MTFPDLSRRGLDRLLTGITADAAMLTDRVDSVEAWDADTRLDVLEARVPYGYEQAIVQEASLSVAATGTMTAAGSAVTITLPAGWTSMAVKVTCIAQWSQTAGAVSLYLCRVLLNSAQTMPPTRVTVTNDRGATTTQTSAPVAAGTGYTADVTCQFQQQLPVGNATLTQLDFLVEKFRTG